ncbi:unnamed protein product [Acanthoscelides obtectus]
MAFSD